MILFKNLKSEFIYVENDFDLFQEAVTFKTTKSSLEIVFYSIF